jgi:Na+/proline symporter
MEGDMLRPVVMVLVVLVFAVIAKGVIDYLGRRHLIAKGVVPEDREPGSRNATRWSLMSNLKWALICLGFGGAVILYDSFQDVFSMTGGFGLMFLGAGLGYLLYFLIAWQWSKKEEQGNE